MFCDLARAQFAIWPWRLGGRSRNTTHNSLRTLMRLFKKARTTNRPALSEGCKMLSFPVSCLTGMQFVWHSPFDFALPYLAAWGNYRPEHCAETRFGSQGTTYTELKGAVDFERGMFHRTDRITLDAHFNWTCSLFSRSLRLVPRSVNSHLTLGKLKFSSRLWRPLVVSNIW